MKSSQNHVWSYPKFVLLQTILKTLLSLQSFAYISDTRCSLFPCDVGILIVCISKPGELRPVSHLRTPFSHLTTHLVWYHTWDLQRLYCACFGFVQLTLRGQRPASHRMTSFQFWTPFETWTKASPREPHRMTSFLFWTPSEIWMKVSPLL